MTPAHIKRVIQQLLVVSANIQNHRQGVRRADAAARGIKRKLTNRNAHAADALIAQTKNALAVGDNNHFNILLGGILQHIFNAGAVRVGDKQTTGTTVNFREVFTRCADRWRVDDWHHLFQMVIEQTVEQGFVGILNITQVNVFIVVVFEILELAPGAFSLLFDGFYGFR